MKRHVNPLPLCNPLRLAAACLGCGLLVLWLYAGPDQRVHRALTALKARDWERLQYDEVAIPRTSAYMAPSSLFAGALMLEQRQFPSALRMFRHAAAEKRLRPWAWLLSGEALYAQNRFREAESNFTYALQLDPSFVEAHRWLAIAYYDIGLMDLALVHLNRVAELEVHDARPHRVMAVIHMDHGSYAVAVEDLQESLRRDPNQVDRDQILIELAQAQFILKRYADAMETLSACEPTAEVIAMRANCLYSRGDKLETRQLAEEALSMAPDQRWAASVLGKLALDEHRYDDAIALLSDAVERAPADYDLRYSLLTALRAAGREDEAEAEMASVEELRELRESFDALVQKASERPYDANLRYQLGLLADRLQSPEMAESWYKAAVVLDATHARALEELREHQSASFNASVFLRGG